MRIKVFLPRHKETDEFRNHTVEKIPLHLVTIFEHVHEAQALQLNVAANDSKHVILYGRHGAYLEMLDVTHLFDSPMVLLDLPM